MNIAPPDMQSELFYLRPVLNCDSTASARNAYGAAAMEIVCRTLALNPIRINGNFDVCLDAEKDGVFYEIKSVHRNSKAVVYDFRLRKERESKVPVKYIFLLHQLRHARNDILQAMIDSDPIILIQDLAFVVAAAAECPRNKIRKVKGSRAGYLREGYNEGYRNIPVSSLFERPHQIVKIKP